MKVQLNSMQRADRCSQWGPVSTQGTSVQYRTGDTCLQISLRRTLIFIITNADGIRMTIFLRFCLRTNQNNIRNCQLVQRLWVCGTHSEERGWTEHLGPCCLFQRRMSLRSIFSTIPQERVIITINLKIFSQNCSINSTHASHFEPGGGGTHF